MFDTGNGEELISNSVIGARGCSGADAGAALTDVSGTFVGLGAKAAVGIRARGGSMIH